ncbi:MAG: DUF3990 domain-containing protein [Sutterella sp.]|nr:DUF3990 domain-containing protein [Sutterella sp.]
MGILTLYHGTPNKLVVPKYGGGDEKHDYGKGFYLTESLDLAKEWAVCRPNETNGWVHKYELKTYALKILDFRQYDALAWLAELMKHRDAADSKRYRMLAKKFIDKYAIDTSEYDVICGWRANASYFFIAKEFVKDNIDIDILEELLLLGGLGIQYCIKSDAAYANLREKSNELLAVPYAEFNERYNQRDALARKKMRELVDSEANKVTKVFSTLFER